MCRVVLLLCCQLAKPPGAGQMSSDCCKHLASVTQLPAVPTFMKKPIDIHFTPWFSNGSIRPSARNTVWHCAGGELYLVGEVQNKAKCKS